METHAYRLLICPFSADEVALSYVMDTYRKGVRGPQSILWRGRLGGAYNLDQASILAMKAVRDCLSEVRSYSGPRTLAR